MLRQETEMLARIEARGKKMLLPIDHVIAELERRFGTSGIAVKEARKRSQ